MRAHTGIDVVQAWSIKYSLLRLPAPATEYFADIKAESTSRCPGPTGLGTCTQPVVTGRGIPIGHLLFRTSIL